MKKFRVSIFLAVAIISAVLYSCKQDSFSEEDAMNLQHKLDKQNSLFNDSMQTANYRVSYTVNVVDASTSALKSTSAISAITGAVVKLVQDTTILNLTVDASGMVTFTNLKPGNANVNITLANYSEVNYTVNLSQNSINGGRQFSNIIPLIPIAGTATGTITGKVTFESDLTNTAPEVAPTGTRVIAMISTSSAALPNSGTNNIVSISYDKLSLTATTDASGNFSMVVPATINGLDYDIIVPDFTVGQKLLQDKYNNRDTSGVLTIPTNFGNSFTSASTVTAGSPVIIKIGAPDYTSTPAVATAVIDNPNGIDHINITNNGGLYRYNAGTFSILLDDATISNSSTSFGAATFNINAYGRVTNLAVSAIGANYLPAADNATLTIPYCKTEAVVTLNTSAAGVITSVNTYTNGIYYVNNPADVVFSYNGATGSGATFTPSFTFSGGVYILNGVAITNGGTGYPASTTVTFNVKASGNLNTPATASLHMTTGSLSAIKVTNEGANYISGQVDVTVGAPNIPGGTQAVASVSISNGKIYAVKVTTPGSGYTSAPAITIINKAENIQAVYTGTVNASGNVSSTFTAVSQGNGYLTIPTVTITSSIPGVGVGASAYPTVAGGKITALTLINAGTGFRGNIPSSSTSYSPPSVNVKGNGSTIVNIDLGTGKRTIED